MARRPADQTAHIVSVNETGESASGSSVKDTTYLIPTGFQSPRYAQLMAEYDFSL